MCVYPCGVWILAHVFSVRDVLQALHSVSNGSSNEWMCCLGAVALIELLSVLLCWIKASQFDCFHHHNVTKEMAFSILLSYCIYINFLLYFCAVWSVDPFTFHYTNKNTWTWTWTYIYCVTHVLQIWHSKWRLVCQRTLETSLDWLWKVCFVSDDIFHLISIRFDSFRFDFRLIYLPYIPSFLSIIHILLY